MNKHKTPLQAFTSIQSVEQISEQAHVQFRATVKCEHAVKARVVYLFPSVYCPSFAYSLLSVPLLCTLPEDHLIKISDVLQEVRSSILTASCTYSLCMYCMLDVCM